MVRRCPLRANYIARPLALLAAVSLVGCGGSGEYRQVTGTITVNGKPLETGAVVFNPIDPQQGAYARGEITTGGKYSLMTKSTEKGAKPGDYVVTVAAEAVTSTGALPTSLEQEMQGVGANVKIERKSLVPERYNASDTSPLKATVAASGSNEHNFDLTE